MKLGSIKDESRDGALVVVSRDLSIAVRVPDIAPNLQAAIDDWEDTAPQLRSVYALLNEGEYGDAFELELKSLGAPLPRAYQWADSSAYVSHLELMRKVQGHELPAHFWTEPLIYQGGSDSLVGPTDPILVTEGEWEIDFEGEVAVVTDDVPMGVTDEEAAGRILLVMLANDITLRNLIPQELADGFGFFQSKPGTAFSPVAVTPDELGDAWNGRTLHLPLIVHLNKGLFGQPNAGVGMTFDFPTLISHAAKTRFLEAGTIVGSGVVSNADYELGSACIAEKRMLETPADGAPTTPYMASGDRVSIDMLDASGKSIFGAIRQKVSQYEPPQ